MLTYFTEYNFVRLAKNLNTTSISIIMIYSLYERNYNLLLCSSNVKENNVNISFYFLLFVNNVWLIEAIILLFDE